MGDAESRLHGVAGADGIVVGPVYRLDDVAIPAGGEGGPEEQARAAAALQAVAARLGEAGGRLRAAGRSEEAEILEASQLLAEDPSLLAEVEALAAGQSAAAALLAATERQAALLAAIPDPYLSARAADVRRLGRQAARLARDDLTPDPSPTRRGENDRNLLPLSSPEREPGSRGDVGARPREHRPSDDVAADVRAAPRTEAPWCDREVIPVVLVAQDLGPTDLADVELEGIVIGGIALAEGSVTSHAAIVARSLGVPLVVGLGERVLELVNGMPVTLDGASGVLVMLPTEETLQQAQAEVERQEQRRARLAESRSRGAVTADGHPICLLANASTEREVLAGLAAGAEGVGLLRTELAFLDAGNWPTTAQHEAAVRPILRHLGGHPVTVRTLDFGADKMPPFLRGQGERGIVLQHAEPGALEVQFRALLRVWVETGVGCHLRVMLPLVERAEQVEVARRVLHAAQQAVGLETPLPSLGAMIETKCAVDQIDAIAAAADFLSIGTNDLVQDLLGLDRLTPVATVRSAADPRVLRAIGEVTAAARRYSRSVEVCGEAAGDPRIAVLLIGLGVAELSAAPSRLDEVRAAIQAVTLTQAAKLAKTALSLGSADAVLALLDAGPAEWLGATHLSSK